jgi:nucleotide-binding universal stress UspA family protein
MFGSIVVGTDGSETANEAVRQATELAKAVGAKVHLVSAFEPVGNQRLREERQQVPEDMQWMVNPREDVEATLKEAAEQLEEAGVSVETAARQGDPADAILDVAEENGADLIIVGNKGMSGAKRFLLGSVPNKVSHHAPCSVMIIRTTQRASVRARRRPPRRATRARSASRSPARPRRAPSPVGAPAPRSASACLRGRA